MNQAILSKKILTLQNVIFFYILQQQTQSNGFLNMFFKNQSMGLKFRIFGFSGQTLVLKGSKFVFSKLRSQSSTSGRSLVFVNKPGFDKASKFVIFLFVLHFVQLYVFTSSTKSLYDLDTYVDGVRLFCFYCVFFYTSGKFMVVFTPFQKQLSRRQRVTK